MANQGVNQGRRRFLTVSTAVVGAVGAGFAAVPFIKSWLPSARAEAAGAPVLTDVSKLEPGQKMTVEWRGKPVFVFKRTKEMIDLLPKQDPRLRDPDSDVESQQPAFAKNTYRSIKPEIMVLVAICTHLGCVPEYVPEIGPQPYDSEWAGGLYCPCHKSRFDLAGRVYQGVPAPTNLVVPPYHFPDEHHVLIGVGPKEAA